MRYDIALFDLDGTLTDSRPGITNSVVYALRSFGIEVDDPSTLKGFLGPPLRDAFREFYGFTEERAELAVKKFREYFSETGIFEYAPYDGIDGMLARLKDAGVTLAIATSKAMVYAERIAERFDLAKYFEVIAGSELNGERSAKSEVIEYALARLDPARKRRAVMIGDRKHDIIGARETGIDGIGAAWGYGSRAELEVAGAARIVGSPEELDFL